MILQTRASGAKHDAGKAFITEYNTYTHTHTYTYGDIKTQLLRQLFSIAVHTLPNTHSQANTHLDAYSI